MTPGLLLSCCSASPSQQPLPSWSRLVHHQQAHIPPREGKDCFFFIKSGPMVVHILSTYGPLPPSWQNLLLLRGHLDLPPTTQRNMAHLQFQGCILTGLNQALQSSIPLSGRDHTHSTASSTWPQGICTHSPFCQECFPQISLRSFLHFIQVPSQMPAP